MLFFFLFVFPSQGIGLDARLGPHFLKASLGFGGSCFKKDVLGMSYLAETLGLPEVAEFWRMAVTMNELRKTRFCEQILAANHGTLRGKKVAVLGVAFKAHTGDTRESAALDVISFLLTGARRLGFEDAPYSSHGLSAEKAKVHVFDPVVEPAHILEMFPSVVVEPSVPAACGECHTIVVCTEWPEFKAVDWETLFAKVRKPALVFDGRLILDAKRMEAAGYSIHRIGTQK